MKCFNCQLEGHLARDCQWTADLSGLPLRVTRRAPDPPSPDYLTARAELGTPSNPDAAALLRARCPWCEAGPWQPCVNRATGRAKPAHDARYTAAGLTVPGRPAMADTARRQVEESRAERENIQLT